MLHRLGSFLSSKTYSDDDVEQAVATIKTLGKRLAGNADEHGLNDIQLILDEMKRFEHSLSVQRVACHALSNLAMQVVAARWIVQKNGFYLIHKAINRFIHDHKLCWLASSAVWNLARPPANRPALGRRGAVDMLNILREHRNLEKVANTAIGALSNLSLLDTLKDLIAQDSHMELILAVLGQGLGHQQISVMTSGSGLLANIAVSDEHAAKLLTKGGLQVVLPLLDWNNKQKIEDETLFRNSCAALNNLVTAEGFLPAFIKARGLEIVLSFLKLNRDNEMFTGLLENCLATIDADHDVDTTSYHYACFHGLLPELKYLYNKSIRSDKPFDLNSQDGRHMTCLDYAIMNDHKDVAVFLSKLAAEFVSTKTEDISEEMLLCLKQGKDVLRAVRKEHEYAISETLKTFPTDLCNYMLGFQSNADMLSAMSQFD